MRYALIVAKTVVFVLGVLVFAAILLIEGSAQTVGHSASLHWAASTTPGVAGYNVYRAHCKAISKGVCPAASEGAVDKIGTSTTTSYTDTTVTEGAAYSYYVTAFCPATGCSAQIKGESPESKHVGALIPTTPTANKDLQ